MYTVCNTGKQGLGKAGGMGIPPLNQIIHKCMAHKGKSFTHSKHGCGMSHCVHKMYDHEDKTSAYRVDLSL